MVEALRTDARYPSYPLRVEGDKMPDLRHRDYVFENARLEIPTKNSF